MIGVIVLIACGILNYIRADKEIKNGNEKFGRFFKILSIVSIAAGVILGCVLFYIINIY